MKPESVAAWRARVQTALDEIEPLEGASVPELRTYLDLVSKGYHAATDLLCSASGAEAVSLEEDREIFEKRWQRVTNRIREIESGET